MPDTPATSLAKASQSPALSRVTNQLALTEKLLAKAEEPFLIPYRKGDKWGFCDRNKNIVIDCIFYMVHQVSSNLYKVRLNEKEAFLNRKGEIIGGYYDWLDCSFSDGFCCAKKEKKFGFINMNGQQASPFIFDRRSKFCEGVASVYTKRTKIRSSFIGVNNLFIKDIQGQYVDAGNFSEGLAAVVPVVEGENYEGQGYEDYGYRVGFINRVGETVIPAIYEFPECIDIPYLSEGEGQGCHYSFINGLAEVCMSDKWGAINKEGEVKIPTLYDFLFRHQGLISGWIGNASVAHYDILGDKLSVPLDPHTNYFCDGFLAGEYNGKWGFLDKSFNIAIPPVYEDTSNFSEGLAPIKQNGLWGFIDTSGNLIIELQYEDANVFSDGLAGVKLNGKYGFIDSYGAVQLNFRYTEIREDFRNGIARVTYENKASYSKTGYIDKNGIEYWEE